MAGAGHLGKAARREDSGEGREVGFLRPHPVLEAGGGRGDEAGLDAERDEAGDGGAAEGAGALPAGQGLGEAHFLELDLQPQPHHAVGADAHRDAGGLWLAGCACLGVVWCWGSAFVCMVDRIAQGKSQGS